MIQQNELITFLVGFGVALFVWLNRRRIAQIPGSTWLLFSYSALLAGWTITIIEGFVLPDLMNALEHLCYMASSVAAAGWCWIALVKERGAQ
ncbi:hypothetical protein MUP29_04105 [bacterium]|nr:hypothetical protein [bacterium]